MTPGVLETLFNQIDAVFFYIAAAIFGIELLEALFKRSLKGKTIWEMVVSASTLIPSLAIEVVLLTGAYSVYYIIAYALPWQVPVTVWSLIALLILADLTYYWEHRIAHEVRLLWTQHAVHHSSRDLNIITAIRFGPLEGVWSLIIHIPLVLIGFAPELVIFAKLLVLGYQAWLHTELIGKLGPLEWVLNTPSHHRVHHGADDKYLDKNYAGMLIIWDRMFGTFQVEEETPRYGLKRDFDSQNPVIIWVSELPELVRDIRGARTWGEVWGYLMRPPGWAPPKKNHVSAE
ncbi:MAG: sterol desaturase family protein [Paracoccaceae bacterium]